MPSPSEVIENLIGERNTLQHHLNEAREELDAYREVARVIRREALFHAVALLKRALAERIDEAWLRDAADYLKETNLNA